MNALVEIGLSNAVVATALAPFVAALTIRRSRPALVHALWLVVLLKLVTPPIVSVGVPGWSGRTEQTNGDTGLVAVAAAPPGAVTASRDAAWTSERVLHPFAPEIAPRDEHAPTNGAVRLAPQERREIDAVALRRPPSTAPHVEEVSLDTGLTTPVAATESLGGQPAAWPSWPVAIGTVWLAGSFVCFVVAALRIARFQRLLRLAGRAPAELQAEVARLARHLGLARVPRVEMVDGHVSPLVWPLARNVWLVLPSGLLARLSAEERTTLLAHELVHIRRRDHWVRLVELTAAGLYWWHPVAWWARRRLRAAEEECCDAWVVESLPEMCTSYARALVAVVGFLQDTADGRRCLPSPASGLGEFGALRQRLTNIFEGNQPARLTRRVRWAVAALALVLLPLALGRTAPPVVEGREGRGAAEAPLAVAAVDDDRQPNQPADPDDRPLAGTVLDSQGQPVARCDVWLMTSTFNTTAGILGYAPTDAAGRFRFVVPGRWFRTNVTFRQEIGLLAHVPGSRPAALGFDRHSIPPAEGVELVLRPQSVTSFQVLGPDGQPVAGADVALTALAAESLWADLSDEEARSFAEGGHLPFRATPLGPIVGKVSVPLPDGFSRLFVSRTDAQGNVELVGLAIEDVAAVTIKSPVYGEQRRALNFIESGNDARPWPGTITLAAVGSLSGRLVSDDSAAVRRVTFTVTSIPPYDPETYVPGNMHTSGIAQVTTDDDGRFDVPRLAQGGLVFSFPTTHADRSRARVPPNRSLRIAGGEQTQVEIPFVRAVRAGGVVRERGTKKPIAGAVVMVLGEDATDEVVTDDQGRYECYIAPGEVMPDPIATSRFVPIDREEYTRLLSKIPADAAEFEFPPIELTPAPTIQGRVIDGDERPAPGAVVRARWLAQDRRHGVDTLHDRELVADERGEFELLGVDPNKELHVE
ncbi:MAG TPA: M56 family metallopeptidase, partial [Pirellulales bacterium]|nr:M56 family metallopeptidase [Pirellulales bacterium]